MSQRTWEPGQPRDLPILGVLQARDGVATEVELRSGRVLLVLNIAWGYDESDEYAHVTTNVSPSHEDYDVDVFFTSEVAVIRDPASHEWLYEPM